jgi:hypothetical protein
MLLKPLGLLWPRLRVAFFLLSGLYQILSSLSPVLALPLPRRAWALVEFFAPLANLDVTLLPSVGCGLGFYTALWYRLFTVAGLVLPAWVIWFVRTNCNCLETLRNKNGGTLRKKETAVHQMPHKLPRPDKGESFGGEPFEGDRYQDRSVLAMLAKRKMRNHKLREGTVSWTFAVICLAHPSITRTMLQLYDCRTMDDGSRHLVADVNIVCNEARAPDSDDQTATGPLDPLYAFYLSIASAVLAGCVALPVLAALKLWRSRKQIAAGVKQPGLAPLYLHCRPSCFLWEIGSIFGRASLAGGLIALERGSLTQLGAGVLLSGVLLAAVMWSRPLDSGPQLAAGEAVALKELLTEAKAEVKSTSAELKRLRVLRDESKRDARENTQKLKRKQRKEAAKLIKRENVVVAGAPQRQWGVGPLASGVVSKRALIRDYGSG